MALESQLRQLVITKLAPLHPVAIESPMEAGVPDVNCIVGWIELKSLQEWPVYDTTIVRPNHFRPAQRNWLRARCSHGGAAWLLLRVADDWCLVWGATAAEHVGVSWTRLELQRNDHSRAWWHRAPQSVELIGALTRRSWLPLR